MYSDHNPPLNGSLALIIFGSVIIAGFFASLGREPQFYQLWENILYTFVFGFVPAGFGTYYYLKAKKKQQTLLDERKEYHVIRLAAEKQGKLTAIDIAIHLKTSHKKAKEVMNELHNRGVFSITVHNEGIVVYQLNDYLAEEY